MPPASEVLANLDDYALWIAAVVAGATAIALVVKRAAHAVVTTHRRVKDLGQKIDALDVLAARELTDGGDSTKALARQAAGIALAVEGLERRVTPLEGLPTQLEALDRRVTHLEEWRERALPT